MNDINPINNTIDLPVFASGEIFIAVMTGIFLLICILAWLFYKYGRKYFIKENIAPVESVPEIDYGELIEQKLANAKKILEQGDYKEFHLKIAELLKFYFEKTCRLDALSMTGSEIEQSEKLSSWQKEQIKRFFSKNDMAKFAGITQEESLAREVLEITEEIISN